MDPAAAWEKKHPPTRPIKLENAIESKHFLTATLLVGSGAKAKGNRETAVN